MARVKRGVVAHARHKKVLEQAKGFFGRRKNTIRTAKAAVDKAGQYAYRDRKVRKRSFRSLWIQRINAAARTEGFTYSRFIHGLAEAGTVGGRRDAQIVERLFGHGPTIGRSPRQAKACRHVMRRPPVSFSAAVRVRIVDL